MQFSINSAEICGRKRIQLNLLANDTDTTIGLNVCSQFNGSKNKIKIK